MKKPSLIQMILLALVLGAIAGVLLGPWAVNLKWIGTIFINMILMIIAPLVFFSIVSGIITLGDPKKLGRIGAKTMVVFLFTSCASIIIALVVATLVKPGAGLSAETIAQLKQLAPPIPTGGEKNIGLMDFLLGVVPNNAMKAMIDRNILQIIFFATAVGISLVYIKDKTPKITQLMHEAAEVCYTIIDGVIKVAPIAVFALTAWTVGVLGFDALRALLLFVFVVVGACLLQYALYCVNVFLSGSNPIPFIKKSLEYQLIAFSTSSSNATMPTTLKVVTKKLGVSDGTAATVIPLGATINMDGTAIYLAACTVFIAQITGVTFGMHEYFVILTTVMLLAIGTAAVPSGSLIMMPVVFSAVGLPVESIALILGVDRILDMVRTTINVTGDAMAAVVVEKTENTLDEKIYNS